MSKYYSTKEVAEKLGYASASVVRTLILNDKIHAERLGGRSLMISEEELQRVKRIRKQYRKRTAKI